MKSSAPKVYPRMKKKKISENDIFYWISIQLFTKSALKRHLYSMSLPMPIYFW